MIHDVAIIGAGPCGLATAARLREPSPSALFTDTEHARFWNRKHDRNTIENARHRSRNWKPGPPFPSSSSQEETKGKRIETDKSIVVFDAHSPQWLGSWRSKFEKLNIEYLRSPLFFHPDPADRDGLLAFAYEEGREGELCEIRGVVGREVSKHEVKKGRKRGGRGVGMGEKDSQSTRHLNLDNRDRIDYFTPSTSLFNAYIDSIVQRYDLSDLVQQATITDVTYDPQRQLFRLSTSNSSRTYLARVVVLATGPANPPMIPASTPLLSQPSNINGSASHIFSSGTDTAPDTLLPPHLLNKPKSSPIHIVIVGGGLTSAQTAHLLLTTHPGITITLLLRHPHMKTKHFDVDLPWIAKLRNREMARFYSADSDEERFQMLRDAKGGGSVTPQFTRILKGWKREDRLNILEGWELDAEDKETRWNNGTMVWNLVVRSKRCGTGVDDEGGEKMMLEDVDHVVFATSTPPSLENVPILKSLRQEYPIRDIHGLPVLTQDLMWCDEVPLFVTGALAGLRLGPGAGNLAGARLGAERIAWGIEEAFARIRGDDADIDGDTGLGDLILGDSASVRRDSGYASEDSVEKPAGKGGDDEDLWNDYTTGLGSRFASLSSLES